MSCLKWNELPYEIAVCYFTSSVHKVFGNTDQSWDWWLLISYFIIFYILSKLSILYFLLFFLAVLGFELKAACLLHTHALYHLSHSPAQAYCILKLDFIITCCIQTKTFCVRSLYGRDPLTDIPILNELMSNEAQLHIKMSKQYFYRRICWSTEMLLTCRTFININRLYHIGNCTYFNIYNKLWTENLHIKKKKCIFLQWDTCMATI
jgi:hypothetical protein